MTAPIGQPPRASLAARRIDFHHHVPAPPHIKGARQVSYATITSTAEDSLAEMEKAGITTALITVPTSTALNLGKDDTASVTRECNDYLAQLKRDHPAHFGMLAAIPLPYIKESLREIEYAYDALDVEGICLATSYGNKWLGHPDFAPVLEMLHERRAVVHVHPLAPLCCLDTLPDIDPSLIEFCTDTARTIASLIFTGSSQQYRDISFIFSHGGGTMPSLIERYNNLPIKDKRYAAFTPQGVVAELRRFYYDTAIITHPAPLSALTNLVPLSQIVFGTDMPYRRGATCVAGLTNYFDAAGMKAIDSENALRLLPRLAAL